MTLFTPAQAAVLADLVLVVHAAIVAFVVGGQVLVLVGGWRGWAVVRDLRLRLLHLGLVVYVAAQAWLERICPLTVWEQALRDRAGQPVHQGSFIEHWVGRLIFFEAPTWVFVAAYTAFALLVAASWRWVPPRRRGTPGRQGRGR